MPHLYASDPGSTSKRRPKLAPCPHCGANGPACDSLHRLRAQTCHERCDGDHDDRPPDVSIPAARPPRSS